MDEKRWIVVGCIVFFGLVLFIAERFLSKKPSGGELIKPEEAKPGDPVEAKKAQSSSRSLMDLYPRDLAREMVKAYLDAMPPPTKSDYELEEEFFRRALGEKANEKPPSTPEWDAAYDEAEIERETDKAIKQMSTCWKSMIGALRLRAKGGNVHLNYLLEPSTPLNFGPGVTWLEASIVSLKLTVEQASKLHEAFVANLRPLIDATYEGYSLWGDDYIILMSWGGYCLLAPTTAEPSASQP